MSWLSEFRRRLRARRLLKQADHPAFVEEYLAACGRSSDTRRDLAAFRFVVLDTETTGLDPHQAELLALGAVAVVGGSVRVANSFEALVRPDQDASHANVEVHGILPAESRAGRSRAAVLAAFLSYIRADIIVAHNAGFDVTLLNRDLKADFGIELLNPVLDTAVLARRLEDPTAASGGGSFAPGTFSLDRLAQKHGVPVKERHSAHGDAFVTAQLLLALFAHARRRGLVSPADLL